MNNSGQSEHERVRELEIALYEAADDLDKAANQCESLVLASPNYPLGAKSRGAERFAEKAAKARAIADREPIAHVPHPRSSP